MREARLRLEGKRVVVSGACGGIGLVSCELFAREGAEVLGCDLHEPSSAEAAQFRERVAGGDYVQADVAAEPSVRRLARHVAERWGRFDALFNNAGAMLRQEIVGLSLGDWDRVIRINLTGTFLMMRELQPILASQRSAILNMSSLSGEVARPGFSAYAAAKAGVIMLSKVAAHEFAPTRVNVIMPGAVDTPMPRTLDPTLGEADQRANVAKIGSMRLLGRIGRPEEIAALAAFLISDESSYVTGSAFAIDGGRL